MSARPGTSRKASFAIFMIASDANQTSEKARKLLRIVNRPTRFVNTIQITTNLIGMITGAFILEQPAAKLEEIGEALAKEYGVRYLPSDFKKKEGYKPLYMRSTLLLLYFSFRQDFF